MAISKKLPAESLKKKKVKGRVQALYCDGTLCSKAELIFHRLRLKGHEFVNLSNEEFTHNRPHPMIEPEIRNGHVAKALADKKVGVILIDLVLGYGAHPDPAGVFLKNKLTKTVIASVTGTDSDPQVRSRQVAALREAGVLVAPSNAHAAELAASFY